MALARRVRRLIAQFAAKQGQCLLLPYTGRDATGVLAFSQAALFSGYLEPFSRVFQISPGETFEPSHRIFTETELKHEDRVVIPSDLNVVTTSQGFSSAVTPYIIDLGVKNLVPGTVELDIGWAERVTDDGAGGLSGAEGEESLTAVVDYQAGQITVVNDPGSDGDVYYSYYDTASVRLKVGRVAPITDPRDGSFSHYEVYVGR